MATLVLLSDKSSIPGLASKIKSIIKNPSPSQSGLHYNTEEVFLKNHCENFAEFLNDLQTISENNYKVDKKVEDFIKPLFETNLSDVKTYNKLSEEYSSNQDISGLIFGYRNDIRKYLIANFYQNLVSKNKKAVGNIIDLYELVFNVIEDKDLLRTHGHMIELWTHSDKQ